MHFQLFIPGGTAKADLIEVGLSHLARNVWTKQVETGPTNGPGLLCSWKTNRDELNQGFRPEFQDWIPAIADGEHFPAERYWIGFEKTSSPTPAHLERDRSYTGATIVLGDGQQWKIPRAESIPHQMIRTDDGETEFVSDPKLRRFYQDFAEWRAFFSQVQPGGKASYVALRDFVESALLINYRLTPEVADYLKLWTSGDQGSVLSAALSICRSDAAQGVTDG